MEKLYISHESRRTFWKITWRQEGSQQELYLQTGISSNWKPFNSCLRQSLTHSKKIWICSGASLQVTRFGCTGTMQIHDSAPSHTSLPVPYLLKKLCVYVSLVCVFTRSNSRLTLPLVKAQAILEIKKLWDKKVNKREQGWDLLDCVWKLFRKLQKKLLYLCADFGENRGKMG